jgi:hypothetical protein
MTKLLRNENDDARIAASAAELKLRELDRVSLPVPPVSQLSQRSCEILLVLVEGH